MLPKGRRKYKFVSFDFEIRSGSNLSYQILGILLIILGNSISSINGVTIKYSNNSNNNNNNDVKIPLDSSTSASSSQTITSSSSSLLLQNSGDASMDGFDDGKHLITNLPNFDDNNYNEYKEYYDRLTTNNPCLTHYCPKGRECILDNNTNKPNCICQRHCTKRKRPICGSNGQIYRNHCRLHQASCLLNIPITYQRLEKCQNKNKHKSYNKQVHYKSSSSLKPGHLKKYEKDFSMNELSSSSLKQQQQYHDNNNTDDDLINNNDSSGSSSSSTNTDTNDDNNDNDKHRTIVIYKDSILGQNNDKSVNNHINNIFDEIITIPAKKLTKDHTKTKFSLYYSNEKENILHQNNINNNNNNNKINNNNNNNNNNLFDMNLMNENHYINDNIDFIDTTLLDRRKICTSQEYEIMKDNLLLFNHARLMSQNNNHSKDFLVSIMFSHYDQNNDAYLEIEELNQISIDEHLEELSNGCILEDMLTFDDLDNDEKLSINEFYQAFSKLYSVSVVSLDKALETNHLSARVGDNVEIKCDVTGSPSPPIIWQRNDIDLSTLNYDDIRVFSDGSLYLTRIQLLHSGNYTCHAQRNKDVVQTHILSVYTIPQVLVMPRIQSKRPGENAEMWCHVTGDPLPKVEWLKNDEKLNLNIPNKYEIIGNGSALQLHNIQYSDTGAYMCQATNIGGTVRDISSLVVQEEPTPTVLNEERKFFVFHENGISIYEPSACRLYHQIQSSDIIPGTQEYICGKESTKCSWGRTVTAGPHYIYATQPELDRVLVISTIQMVVVDVVQTDKYPVELFYVQKLDQIWILNWQYKNNIGKKIVQVICEAGQKRKHYTIHPELIDGQIDLIKNLFIPSPDLEQPHFSYNYGYITHQNQRNIYKLDLANLRYIKSVDLTLYDCVPDNIEFSALYGFVILSCQEPTTDRPRGQLILDYLTDAVLITKPSLYGIPKISPDSRNLVTIQHHPNETVIVVQKITSNGLEFMFDVKTTLNVSDVTFYESQTTHGYDLFASANDKENILYLNLCTGKVEMITGVGLPISKSLIKWENPARMIRSSGLFGLYMLTTANSALFVINGRARSINCKIGGVKHPTAIVWTHALPNYITNRNTIVNEL